MKAMSISAIIVAGILVAFGMGLMGPTSESNGSPATNASANGVKKEGCCCQSAAAQTAQDGAEKPACCSAGCEHSHASTGTDEKKKCGGGACCKEKSTNVLTSTGVADDEKPAAEQCAQCPVSAAMAKLPKMTYAVGTEKTCCSDKAKSLAEQHKAPIQYVVADKTYDDQTAAMTALVEETETFVAAFTSPKKCEASGKTTIAGQCLECPMEAEKQSTLVNTAIEAVKMEYEVAGEKANCPSCAATMSKEKSAPVEYVVGDQKTSCELTARLNLAHAKYKAAVQALAAKPATTEANAG